MRPRGWPISRRSPRRSRPATRAAIPAIPLVGYYSLWNEPNLAQFLAPAYKAGKPSSPARLRPMARAAIAGIKAGNSKAQVAIGETSPRGRQRPARVLDDTGHDRAGSLRQARRGGAWAARQVRRLGPPSVLRARPGSDGEGRVPERQPHPDAGLREEARSVVQAEGDADLGHRVRLRDEARRAEGGDGCQAGRVHQAGARVRPRRPERGHVHLVHLPRRPDEHVAERPRERDNTRKPAFATFTQRRATLDFRSPIVYMKPKTSNPVRPRSRLGVAPHRRRRRAARRDSEDVLQAPQHRRLAADVDDRDRRLRELHRAAEASRRSGRSYTVSFNINDKNGNRLYRSATIIVP